MTKIATAALAAAVAGTAATAQVETFDTQGFVNGQAVGLDLDSGVDFGSPSTQFGLSYTGPGSAAAVFDTTVGGVNASSSDADLLVGNGFALIAQESGTPTGTPPVFATPDDEARTGSVFTFDFTDFVPATAFDVPTVTLFSISVIDFNGDPADVFIVTDIDGDTLEVTLPSSFTINPSGAGSVGEPDGIEVIDLTGGVTTSLDTGAVTSVVETGDFDFDQVVSLRVELNGSGALDDLFFGRNIPTPASAVLVAAAGLAATRRRRAA